MDITAYEAIVVPIFNRLYPELKDVRVTEIVQDTLGGDLVVVRSSTSAPHEEIAFIYPDHRVKVFSTTEELANFLSARVRRSWFERLFTNPVLSGIVFAALLIFLMAISVANPPYNATVVALLGNVVSIAAGFFFGSSRTA